jgi:hypothetical protein
LVVTGDRHWLENGEMSRPEPFRTMPISYDRAYGGSVEVLLDEESPMTMRWPHNPKGLGYCPEKELDAIKEKVYCAPGYPRISEGFIHRVPNIEWPDDRMATPRDTPQPAGFGTVEFGSPLHMVPWLAKRAVALEKKNEQDRIEDIVEAALQPSIPKEAMLRCHPAWCIDPPEPKSNVGMTNLTADGHVSFQLPALGVYVDYRFGDSVGTRRLTPFMLVLLPEENRFYLVYRDMFEVSPEKNIEKSLRLRLLNEG